ncbi:hypothetical protein B7Y94_02190 [Candidatus Saccharibacteria bacterium 32-49-12]|nr:MAG: hypothetical protein B7Y94_02190 [Candidatus Saccharibacteria bacterium 32-49-12]
MTKKLTVNKLHRYNIIAGFLHLAQAVAILILSKESLFPVIGNFLKFNTQTQSLEPATTTLFEVSLPLLVTGFFLLSSIAHFSVATYYRKRYEAGLKDGINRARWIEYSVSASVMMVAISLLVGIYDLMSLVMIFGLTAIMNLMGLVMEVHNQTTRRTNWLSYWVGCIAGILPWVAIAFYMWLGADQGSKAPDFVYWIFVSIFVFFNCFAINMMLQYKKVGPWKDYLYGEFVYIILSLVAKSLLAWQVFAGTLQP